MLKKFHLIWIKLKFIIKIKINFSSKIKIKIIETLNFLFNLENKNNFGLI